MTDKKTKIEYMLVNDLVPYSRNPRTHSEEQVIKIMKSIEEFGFTNPILIKDDNTIIAGHGRYVSAKQLNMDKIPCIRLSHLTEEQVQAYGYSGQSLGFRCWLG